MAWLLGAQSTGEVISRGLGMPIPGPVVGMGLLMVALFWPPIRRSVGVAAQGLLAHLSLLFVPVGVGVMSHLDLLSEYGGRLLAILLLSTWAGLLATAWVFKALMPKATS